MIALPNYFPYGCAGPNGCDDPACSMCNAADTLNREMRIEERPQTNPERDGAPKLSAEKERRHPMFEKRHRQGPHRGNA